MSTRWVYKEKIPEELRREHFVDFDPILAQLLFNRGLRTRKEGEAFLLSRYDTDTHDPFRFHDMEKAVARVQEAIRKREKIIAHGDYDADGICGAAVLFEGLKALGSNVGAYIPHREKEGYGVNKNTIQVLAKQGVKLVITADCGISNHEEIALAKGLGIDVIVTDHHIEPMQFPKDAYAVINPNVKRETYPFKGLAGVGVAFKFISALYTKTAHMPGVGKTLEIGAEQKLLDLVAISTVTDMMPLLDENRIFVREGLKVLRTLKRVGIRALSEITRMQAETMNERHIGFVIGPRLNAAGRLEHAWQAYQMLTTENISEAYEIAHKLEQVNEDRRLITDLITKEVEEQLGAVSDEQKVLFAFGKDWPLGVVGLVAGKVAQKYNRPVFILGEAQGNIVASGRSVPAVNIVEVLQESAEFYKKYGGHAAACGFTLKQETNMEAWKTCIEKLFSKKLGTTDTTQLIHIEHEAALSDITWDLWKHVAQLAPYGQGNPEPIFVTQKVRVKQAYPVGKDQKHLKLILEQGQVIKNAIAFGFGRWIHKLSYGQIINVAFRLEENIWNGRRDLQMKIVDMQL